MMRDELNTAHPVFMVEAAWLGRAVIEFEEDEDAGGNVWESPVASVQDLFFVPDINAAWPDAHRVELPDNSRDGNDFRYKLERAAIEEYHNPKPSPVMLPDELAEIAPVCTWNIRVKPSATASLSEAAEG